MDGSFVKEVVASTAKPVLQDVAGEPRLIAPAGWQEIRRTAPPAPGVLTVNTLDGLCDYVEANRDGLDLKELLLHVESHDQVSLVSKLKGDFHQRHQYVRAQVATLFGGSFAFGAFQTSEAFIVGLQALFAASPTRDQLITLVGSIREDAVKETVDDGYAQSVKTGAGVVMVGEKRVPNPVDLRPFRTFREVEQPESPFVLRLQGSGAGDRPKIALFEADGGKWKLTAIAAIDAYLKDRLKDGVAILA